MIIVAWLSAKQINRWGSETYLDDRNLFAREWQGQFSLVKTILERASFGTLFKTVPSVCICIERLWISNNLNWSLSTGCFSKVNSVRFLKKAYIESQKLHMTFFLFHKWCYIIEDNVLILILWSIELSEKSHSCQFEEKIIWREDLLAWNWFIHSRLSWFIIWLMNSKHLQFTCSRKPIFSLKFVT